MTERDRLSEMARRLEGATNPGAAKLAEAVSLFAPLGWAMCGRWHQNGTLRVLRDAARGVSPEDIDKAITEVWNSENRVFLQHAAAPIRQWSNSHYPFKQVLWDRVALIEKAIQHHFAGAYEASIPIILAQIDGMSRDLTGQSFFSKANADPYLDDETLAGIEENLPVVRRVFSADVRESGSFGYVSRHGVLHGRDLGYATRVNSTKTIVLVAALAEYFPRVANDAGARLRGLHEEAVAGSNAVDDKGRPVDDRRIPELLNFAYDFDTEYLNAVLLSPRPFSVHTVLKVVAKKHGLELDAFRAGQDDVGCWWYYTIPAGWTLGYAARPTTSTERRHPDVWRWDALEVPTTLPWTNADGWRSDDDFPRSPNWEPKFVT